MPPTDGWSRRLLEGLAQDLHNAGVGIYRPDGTYKAGETGVVLTVFPTAPDRIVSLSLYDVDNNPGHSDTIVGVQARIRGLQDPRDVGDLADAIHDAWHGAERLDLPTGIHVAQLWRNSHAPMGQDGNKRHEAASNYYLRTARPSRHARD